MSTHKKDLADEIAIAVLPAIYLQCEQDWEDGGRPKGWRTVIAQEAYLMAEAMILAR